MKFQNPEVEAKLDLYFQLPRDNNLLLFGPPGSGKTMAVIEFAKRYGREVFHVTGRETLQDIDVLGGYVKSEREGEFRWTDGPLVRAMRAAEEGRPVVFLVDEINRLPAVHQNLFIELINTYDPDRYLVFNPYLQTTHAAPKENFMLAATANLGVYQAGTNDIPAPLADRLQWIEVDYPDPKTEQKIVAGRLSRERRVFAAFIVKFGRHLREVCLREGMLLNPVSTRSLVKIASQFEVLGQRISNLDRKAVLRTLFESEILKGLGGGAVPEWKETAAGLLASFDEHYLAFENALQEQTNRRSSRPTRTAQGAAPDLI